METERRTLMVEGRQIPQARPRVTKNGTYNPRNVWREAIQWEASQVFRGFPLEGRRALDIRLEGCFRRGDLDNFLKPILDGLQGYAYKNDNQVDDVRIQRHGPGKPYTAICVSVISEL